MKIKNNRDSASRAISKVVWQMGRYEPSPSSTEELHGLANQKFKPKGGNPGLVAMGDDSCSKGCGFEYWMDFGHFSHWFVVQIVWKRPKINEKVAGVSPFF